MINQNDKKRHLINIFTRHPVAANLLMALMILSGLFSISKLNTQFFPSFDLNLVQVRVIWPGANAEDVAKSITRPLEQELRQIDYLKEIKSNSRLGISVLTLEFNQRTDMSTAINQVREKIDQIRNLPEESEKPAITRVESFDTVAKLILTGSSNMRLQTLRPIAYTIERQLLDAGISKINMNGLPDQQITVAVTAQKLAELRLTLNQIAEQIRKKSQDVPAGTIGLSQLGKQLRAIQQKRTIKDFESIPLVSKRASRLLYLKDIAKISLEPQDQEHLIFYNNKPAIVIQLQRSKRSSALRSAKILNQWLTHFRPTLGPHIHIHVYSQRWSLIQERINLLLKNGLGGLILIIFILLFFLHSRIAWWVLLGIPVSFCAALTVLYFMGGSINMVSLFGLIMTLGIIVDDTIVVSEEAFTQLQKGKKAVDAVTTGTRKMLVPILSSSLTTVCAFIPLLLIGGVIGNILFDIPIVVICVILASLIECFLVLPGHLYHSLKNQPTLKESKLRKKINIKFNHFRDHTFKRTVILALKHRGFTILSALALFILAFALLYFGILKFNFFPSPEGRLLYANVHFSAGTKPQTVSRFMKQVTAAAEETSNTLKPKGDNLITTLVRFENQTSKIGNTSPSYGDQYGGIELELLSPDQRKVNNQQFIKQWREAIRLPAGIENFSITTRRSGPPGVELDIAISGNTLDQLKVAGRALMDHLKAQSGVTNIKDDIPYGQNQIIYSLNATGKALGLTIQEISQQLRAALSGALAEVYHTATNEIEVRVMLPKRERHDLSLLKRFPIMTPAGKITPLESIISVKSQKGFDMIRHTNTKPTLHVTAEVDKNLNNENTIRAELSKNVMPQLAERYHIQYKYSGRAEDQKETFRDMGMGLILGLLLIYIILAWVFSSYGWPLIVMLTIPLGLTGAIFGHYIIGINLTLLSLFGLFGLSGIVVNDAIILLSTYKHLRPHAINVTTAIVDATCQRLRAVLLTSLTTIAGLTPLLFERSLQAQFLIPMAVSITFGLAYATLLILIVIPTLLSFYEGMVRQFERSYSD